MIVAMLRVKNESRWIGEVLASLQGLVEHTFVMDDHSEDKTMEICRRHGAHVVSSPFTDLNEGRDKNWLLAQVRLSANPRWIVHIDGDEILEEGSQEELLTMMESDQCDFIRLRVVYLWDSRDQIRTDGIYGKFRRGSIFRAGDGQYFTEGFHCSNVPTRGWSPKLGDANARLLHLGYMERADRIRKYIWYNEKDPHNKMEDGYRHMVAGDELPAWISLPSAPASLKTKHAGPLTLSPLR